MNEVVKAASAATQCKRASPHTNTYRHSLSLFLTHTHTHYSNIHTSRSGFHCKLMPLSHFFTMFHTVHESNKLIRQKPVPLESACPLHSAGTSRLTWARLNTIKRTRHKIQVWKGHYFLNKYRKVFFSICCILLKKINKKLI